MTDVKTDTAQDYEEVRQQLMTMFREIAKKWKRSGDRRNKREALCDIVRTMAALEGAAAKTEMSAQVKRLADALELQQQNGRRGIRIGQ